MLPQEGRIGSLQDSEHHPSDDTTVDWSSRLSHLQQDALDLNLCLRRLGEQSSWSSSKGCGHVLVEQLLISRQQLMLIIEPTLQRTV
jgi:hypothetical protein